VPLTDVAGTTVVLPNATAIHTVSVTDATNAGAVSGYDFTLNSTVLNLEAEPNNSVATATPLVAGTPTVGALTAADKDYFSFTVTTAGTYQFDTSNAGVTVDTRIYVCLAGAATCVYSTTDLVTSNSGQDEDSGPGLYSSLPPQPRPGQLRGGGRVGQRGGHR